MIQTVFEYDQSGNEIELRVYSRWRNGRLYEIPIRWRHDFHDGDAKFRAAVAKTLRAAWSRIKAQEVL